MKHYKPVILYRSLSRKSGIRVTVWFFLAYLSWVFYIAYAGGFWVREYIEFPPYRCVTFDLAGLPRAEGAESSRQDGVHSGVGCGGGHVVPDGGETQQACLAREARQEDRLSTNTASIKELRNIVSCLDHNYVSLPSLRTTSTNIRTETISC